MADSLHRVPEADLYAVPGDNAAYYRILSVSDGAGPLQYGPGSLYLDFYNLLVCLGHPDHGFVPGGANSQRLRFRKHAGWCAGA
ncbi:hypothetical protein D3C76_1429760 [compost metagenome]